MEESRGVVSPVLRLFICPPESSSSIRSRLRLVELDAEGEDDAEPGSLENKAGSSVA